MFTFTKRGAHDIYIASYLIEKWDIWYVRCIAILPESTNIYLLGFYAEIIVSPVPG